MNKYKVELAAPAVSMYTYLSAHSGEKDGAETRLLNMLDEIINDVMPFHPFDSGNELGGRLAGIYWISQDTLHIFYEASPKPRTVVVLSIWDGPNSEAHVRQRKFFAGKCYSQECCVAEHRLIRRRGGGRQRTLRTLRTLRTTQTNGAEFSGAAPFGF